eukprot:4157461-Ditylum_brightwellii.AAC.1
MFSPQTEERKEEVEVDEGRTGVNDNDDDDDNNNSSNSNDFEVEASGIVASGGAKYPSSVNRRQQLQPSLLSRQGQKSTST